MRRDKYPFRIDDTTSEGKILEQQKMFGVKNSL